MTKLSYEKTRDRIFEELSSIKASYYSDKESTCAANAFLLQAMIELEGCIIEDSDGNDRTQAFLRGLRNIMVDPYSRIKLYIGEEVDKDSYILTAPEGYQNIPSFKTYSKEACKILYIQTNKEIGRMAVTKDMKNGVATIKIDFLEFIDEEKNKHRIKEVLDDVISEAYGNNVVWEISNGFEGRPEPFKTAVKAVENLLLDKMKKS